MSQAARCLVVVVMIVLDCGCGGSLSSQPDKGVSATTEGMPETRTRAPKISSIAVSPTAVRFGRPLPYIVIDVRRTGTLLVYVLRCEGRSVACGGRGKNIALARMWIDRTGGERIPLSEILRRSLLRPKVTRMTRGEYDIMFDRGPAYSPDPVGAVRFQIR